jgi:hypothetical protein
MNKFVFYLFILICCTLIRCANHDSGINSSLIITPGDCLPDVEDKYVYPVHRGTEEWASASAREREEKLSQLPEDKLKTLSTYALIRSLLDYPLLWNYYLSSHSSPVVSCDRFIFSQHNSVPEFEKRKNRIEALLSYYAALNLDCYEAPDAKRQMDFVIQVCVLEVWFIRDAVLHSMNDTQKKQAVSLLLQKHRQRQSYSDASLVAMAWIMYDAGYSPLTAYYQNKTLSKDDLWVDDDQRNDIISFAENYTC